MALAYVTMVAYNLVVKDLSRGQLRIRIMIASEITQAEADALMAMEKHRTDDREYLFPKPGESLIVPLVSFDKREEFVLDVYRGSINLKKVNYQNRARQVIPLVRLDISGSPHRNPDDEEISGPHLHLYREGFGAKWAYPIDLSIFGNIDDILQTLSDFLRFCNIINPPNIREQRGLYD